MASTTRRSRYSTVAIILHWVIAVLLIANLVVGLWVLDPFMDSPDPADKQIGFALIQAHKSVGLTVLVLAVLRLLWRLLNPPPALPDHMTPTEHLLAKVSHWGFYIVMLAMPLTGWAMSSTGKLLFPILYFGLFEVPHLPLPKAWGGVFSESHALLGWLTLAMISLHVAAALKHHYFDRDDVLARMLPWRARRAG